MNYFYDQSKLKGLPNLSFKIILQRAYECFCTFFTVMLLDGLKQGTGFMISGIIVLFLTVYPGRNINAHRIAFAISFGFLAYLAWTEVITVQFTNFLDRNDYIHDEHSPWDLFAFLLPVLFAIATFCWVLKKRKQHKNFDLVYLSVSALALFIAAFIL